MGFNFDNQNKMKLKNVHSTNVNNNKDEQIFEHRDRSTFKDSTSDLTLFKFARSGETGWDQIETKHSKRKINFFQHGHPENNNDQLYDMSKSTEEIINMPIASNSNTASETSTPTLLRGILRTASTADSSRRVTWSPMPINATTANDDVLYTNTKSDPLHKRNFCKATQATQVKIKK